jgi:hypothetical protein
MPHINHRRGETRRKATDYPYNDSSYHQEIQRERNQAEKEKGRREIKEASRE